MVVVLLTGLAEHLGANDGITLPKARGGWKEVGGRRLNLITITCLTLVPPRSSVRCHQASIP